MTTPYNPKNQAAQRLENVFAWLLEPLTKPGQVLAGLRVVPARKRSEASGKEDEDEDEELPIVVVYASGAKEDPELDGEWEATLAVNVKVQADDFRPEGLSEMAGGVIGLLAYTPDLREALNFPNPKRPDPDFMLQDTTHQDVQASNAGRAYVESVIYQVRFRNDDGQGP